MEAASFRKIYKKKQKLKETITQEFTDSDGEFHN